MNETLNAAAWSLMYVPNWVIIAIGLVVLGVIGGIAYASFRRIRKLWKST